MLEVLLCKLDSAEAAMASEGGQGRRHGYRGEAAAVLEEVMVVVGCVCV